MFDRSTGFSGDDCFDTPFAIIIVRITLTMSLFIIIEHHITEGGMKKGQNWVV